MNRMTILFLLAAILWVGPGNVCPAIVAAQTDDQIKLDPGGVPWKALRYHAKNWAVDLTATMKLETLPAAEAEAVLLPSPRGTVVSASGPEVFHLSLEMMMDIALQNPVKITNDVWFNPDDAGPLGRFRLRRGKDDFEKTYRFTEQGVFRRNREPRGKEDNKREPHQWSRRVETYFPHDLGQLACPAMTDRLLLIYIVAAAENLETSQPLALCVFGKRQLHRVTLQPDGTETIAVDFITRTQQSTTHRKDDIDALKIKLVAEPLASDLEKPENFSFLGLHKNIAIYIDPVARLPIRVSGDISTVAHGDLKLIEVQFK